MVTVALGKNDGPPTDPVQSGIARHRRKRGGQPSNRNSTRHGLYAAKLYEWCSEYAARQTGFFRRQLEKAVTEKFGEITIYSAALIQTATEATRAALANRELRAKHGGDLKVEILLAMDREYLSHLDRRDRKLKDLGIDASDIAPPVRADDPLAGVTIESVPQPAAPQPADSRAPDQAAASPFPAGEPAPAPQESIDQ